MSTPATPDVVPTFGPYLVGMSLQFIFMGLIAKQVYDYYTTFTRDVVFKKAIVGALAVTTVFQTTMDFINLYRCTVTGYGNLLAFDLQNWSLWGEIVVTAIAGSIAQTFFLERCWKVTRSMAVVAGGAALILLSLGAGLASTIKFAQIERLSLVPSIPIPIIMWLSVTALIDVILSAILVASFVKKNQFQFIPLTIETGSLTACIAVINLILYLALPGLAWHLIPQLVMGKMYAMSVMVTVTSRPGPETANPTMASSPTENGSVSASSMEEKRDFEKL
ncbi:hypothetical protein BOTBODRAFT_174886 [Botryobasidium botryosum FD-172 SS1]|uniref:DUF6534 domain-containing protein n=1 Tax=Botryobasidium botryosum (strain FD-172 SS1) TaxID=930990 RepID=A0A067MRD5_BOTB1|nr:hypothetical protein BOTBODRAFT_174886 [Botryobasidium botryosum FD-172 SS1]